MPLRCNEGCTRCTLMFMCVPPHPLPLHLLTAHITAHMLLALRAHTDGNADAERDAIPSVLCWRTNLRYKTDAFVLCVRACVCVCAVLQRQSFVLWPLLLLFCDEPILTHLIVAALPASVSPL